MSDERSELGSATSEATMRDLEEVACRRAASTGRPVIACTWSSSGTAKILDYGGPPELDEGELIPVADVRVWASPPAKGRPSR